MQTVTQRETLKPIPAILAYQNDRLLKRYSVDYGIQMDESERCFKAFKEFMIVCASKPGYKVTSDSIDRMWHTFLLFTKDYKNFCEDYLGMFIHHEPFEHPTPAAYLETRAFAQNLFGQLDEKLWPVEAKGDCSSGCAE